MTALFITATGTDVGKTYVACLMTRALRAGGRRVRALKPVASGFDPGRVEDTDTGRLLSSLGSPIDAATLDDISPWRFAAPLSPDMAAARENRAIDWSALLAYCRRAIDEAEKDGTVALIEGIGGVMVPLDERRTVLDWIAALAVPSLLVAGSYLGTLSHTLTAAGMLAARGCPLAGIAVSESPDQPVPPEETAETLRRFLSPVPIIVVPRDAPKKGSEPVVEEPCSAASALAALLERREPR